MSTPQRPELHVDRLLRALVDADVDFVVIGGVAAMLHGSPRVTFDLDICFATDAANLEALGGALTGLRARLKGVADDVRFMPDAATLRRIEVLTLTTEAGEIDVLARPSGAPRYETLRSNADRFDLAGLRVRVAAIDDLVAMKSAAGRAKDLADVEELEAIRRLSRRR